MIVWRLASVAGGVPAGVVIWVAAAAVKGGFGTGIIAATADIGGTTGVAIGDLLFIDLNGFRAATSA